MISFTVLWLIVGFGLWFSQQWMKTKCSDQSLAMHWSKEQDYAQIRAFFSKDREISKQEIQTAEEEMNVILQQNGRTDEAEQDWISAYSTQGQLTVSGEKMTETMQAIGVGGDFFFFHPFVLKTGTWFDSNKNTTPMVVLNETAAWKLFGSLNVEGMEVEIEGEPYSISGVIQLERNSFLEKTGALESQIYLAYDQLKKHRDNVGIICYEIIMPNPIQQFALTTIKKQAIFSENDVELVEHSDRFSIKKRIQELPDFFTRSMKQNEIYYPFWENETRAWEQVWDLILIIQMIWGIVGIGFIIVLIKTVDCKNLLLLRKGCIGSPSENATKLWIKPTDNRF